MLLPRSCSINLCKPAVGQTSLAKVFRFKLNRFAVRRSVHGVFPGLVMLRERLR